MARFVLVQVGCDWTGCETVAPEGEGIVVSKTLSIDGKQAREFLLCKKHVDDFELTVLPLMAAGVKISGGKKAAPGGGAAGASGDPATGATAPVCQVPDCNRHGNPLVNRTGMAQHVIRTHGFEDLAAYEAVYGTVT